MPSAIIRFVDHFDEAIVSANSRTYAALDWAADEIERIAKENSRKDTGNMQSGWQQAKISNSARVVYNPVYYTIFHEEGFYHYASGEWIPPQPMLRPAVEQIRPQLIEKVRRAWFATV